MDARPGGPHPLSIMVGQNQEFRFSCTGGYWSDFFFHNVIKKMNCKYIPCFLDEGVEKDRQQFDLWCKVNGLNGEIFDDRSFPASVYLCDYTRLMQGEDRDGILKCFPTLISDFYKYLESKMVFQCGSTGEGFPHPIYSRDIYESLRLLLALDSGEVLPDGFRPGYGFEWLRTANYKAEHYSVYGELTTRDYLENMYQNYYIDSLAYPELQLNKNSNDFRVNYTNGVRSVGFVPPKSKSVVKINYPWQCEKQDYDIFAKQFFSDSSLYNMIGKYQAPNISLIGEYYSVSKFCPCTKLHCGLSVNDLDNVYNAFKYCVNDWKFERGSCKILSEDEIIPVRNWKTSPGYPYNKHVINCEKAFMDYYGLICHYIKFASFDWMPTIFNVFCKDELLKDEKVARNDIRTIIAPAICNQLCSQRVSLDLTRRVSGGWRNSHTSIGRTRYHGHVDATARRISRFPIIHEYDVSKWDRSIKAFLMKLFWVYVWYVLDSDSVNDFWMLSNVFESSIYSHMLHRGGEVIRKAYGVPSGFTLTSYCNSWIHTFLNVLMYYELKPDGFDNMSDHIDFVVYGDDGLMGMSAECSKWFTVEARSYWLKVKFDMDLKVENCLLANEFYLSNTPDGDVTGISFLGDVICYSDEYKQFVPVFKMCKVINQFIFGGRGKKYTPSELLLICFTHYVECFFHPNVDVIRLFLIKLLDKFKCAEVCSTNVDSDILNYFEMNCNCLITHIRAIVNDVSLFRDFIYNKLYHP